VTGPVVSARGLVKRYGDVEALCGIDLVVERGGIVGLLGPNGAGKTTLVEILEGLRPPTSGQVRVLGLDPAVHARPLRERLGVQLQSTSLQQDLTCAEVLRAFAAFYARSLAPGETLARVGLAEKADARVRTLSGGQQQRLALALALVSDPELVLLDEPTSGLDPAARRALHETVRGLRAGGKTVLLTTHYIEEAEALCDRVVMIRSGRLVADGSPFELLGRAAGASTIWLAVDGELDPAPLLLAGCSDHGREGGHHRFTTTDPSATIVALGDILRSQRLQLVDLRLKRPTLEDVYLELMGESAAS
jgi:ABC-2 type transport system ATP-binding protein